MELVELGYLGGLLPLLLLLVGVPLLLELSGLVFFPLLLLKLILSRSTNCRDNSSDESSASIVSPIGGLRLLVFVDVGLVLIVRLSGSDSVINFLFLVFVPAGADDFVPSRSCWCLAVFSFVGCY